MATGRATALEGITHLGALPVQDHGQSLWAAGAVPVSPDVTTVVPGLSGVFLPTVVRAGRVVGTWRRDWLPTSADAVIRRFKAGSEQSR